MTNSNERDFYDAALFLSAHGLAKQNADDFKKLLNADPFVYQNITVLFSNNQSQFKSSDFTGIEKGLGNEEYPFMGTVKANEGSAINLPINFALFEYLSDSANLDTIIFARPEEKIQLCLLRMLYTVMWIQLISGK